MPNVKEEPVDAGTDTIGSISQDQYYSHTEDTDVKQENIPKLESGVDKEFRIVSVYSTGEANTWGDPDVGSLLHVWSDERISHQLKETDENIVDGSEGQAFTLQNKRKGGQNDHQVQSKKLICDHRRTCVPLEPLSTIHAKKGPGGIQAAQNFIDQHGAYVKDQSEHHRYKPQILQLHTRFPADSIFNHPSKCGRPISGKLRKVCKDIICLPAEYPEENCTYRVPRGKEREQLAMLGLVGKILIHPSWNFENFRTEMMTLFRKYFSCSEEEFSFNFLQCLPGNRKLIKPNVSATFKWSGIAIISLAAQGSLYIKTPHRLAGSTEDLFFNIKQRLPDIERKSMRVHVPSDRQTAEINQPGDPHLIDIMCHMDKENSQHCTTIDLSGPRHQGLTQDHSEESPVKTGERSSEKPNQGISKETCEVPQHLLEESIDKISTWNTAIQCHTERESCNMTKNIVFKLLRDAGIKTAKKTNENISVSRGCELIPIVCGCWRIATGLYLKRHPDTEGRRLYPPRVEIFHKDDVYEDVACSKEQLVEAKMDIAGLPIGQAEIDIIRHSMVAMFEILEKACLAADLILVNMKVQFGVDLDSKEIVLADVIEYNCWHKSQLEDKPQPDNKQKQSPRSQGRVVVLMESISYLVHCEKIKASCAKYSIPCDLRVSSAYTGPGEILDIKSQYEGDGTPTVFITVAGKSNGLASVLSANTAYPVIYCPAGATDWSSQDVCSALSTPESLGFCTVLSPEAAAQFSAHILALSDQELWSRLRSCILNKWISVKQADEKLRSAAQFICSSAHS